MSHKRIQTKKIQTQQLQIVPQINLSDLAQAIQEVSPIKFIEYIPRHYIFSDSMILHTNTVIEHPKGAIPVVYSSQLNSDDVTPGETISENITPGSIVTPGNVMSNNTVIQKT